MAGIAGAGDDRQVGMGGAQFFDEALGGDRLIHGEDHCGGSLNPQLVQLGRHRGIAEYCRITLA